MKRLARLVLFVAGAVAAFELVRGEARLLSRATPAVDRLWKRILFAIEEGVRASRAPEEEREDVPDASRGG